jgi:hypothetical protein
MSGFSYSVAVRILADNWMHGEQLRRWHNLEMQIGDEGEQANESGAVLNLSLISIKVSEDPSDE